MCGLVSLESSVPSVQISVHGAVGLAKVSAAIYAGVYVLDF